MRVESISALLRFDPNGRDQPQGPGVDWRSRLQPEDPEDIAGTAAG
jgi:hypothetical protein